MGAEEVGKRINGISMRATSKNGLKPVDVDDDDR